MTTYWELLKDPQWQRKRLEIMERDGFACVDCGASDKTLNVHHTYYAKGRKPWEYESESLKTLCEPCHAATEKDLAELRRLIGRLEPWDRSRLEIYIRFTFGMLDPKCSSVFIADFHDAAGAADSFGMLASDVIRLRGEDGYVSFEDLKKEAQRRLNQWMAFDLDEQRRLDEGGK